MKAKLFHDSESGRTRMFLDDVEIERVLEYSIGSGYAPAIRLILDVDQIEHHYGSPEELNHRQPICAAEERSISEKRKFSKKDFLLGFICANVGMAVYMVLKLVFI